MKRPIHLILICLLMLSLSWPAGASMPTAIEACVMQIVTKSHDGADCCGNPDETAQTGSPCKAGQACQMGVGWALRPLQLFPPPPSESRSFNQTVTLMSGTDAAGIWRPPE